MLQVQAIADQMINGTLDENINSEVTIYKKSYVEYETTKLLMVKFDHIRLIIAVGSGKLIDELRGKVEGNYKVCELTHENRLIINQYFPYTVPQAFGKQIATIGLGDRLGIASPGHIQTIANKNIKPILAQQSIRELNLTGRNYREVLDAACYAAFQEGYTGGFGADGDHLKTEEDIEMSLELGFTMLTLDCSDKINNSIEGSELENIQFRYDSLDNELKKHYENKFLNKEFKVMNRSVTYSLSGLMKNVLIYHEAIEYMKYIYHKYIQHADRAIDFEISIDETLTPTAPESHFFVAKELHDAGIDIFSMAPRFCGEFQKGIDYIGDIKKFEQELIIHAGIADHFGYKLSIHSGSDKFSVFPIIARYTKGRFHVKTAGTNWLEAVRTVAKIHPKLYRRMHTYALEHVQEALAYYHVSANFNAIKPLSEMSDRELPNYMDDDNTRQLIHITYGLLLQAKDGDGNLLFKAEFFKVLIDQEEEYGNAIKAHIGKHLQVLGK